MGVNILLWKLNYTLPFFLQLLGSLSLHLPPGGLFISLFHLIDEDIFRKSGKTLKRVFPYFTAFFFDEVGRSNFFYVAFSYLPAGTYHLFMSLFPHSATYSVTDQFFHFTFCDIFEATFFILFIIILRNIT